MCVVSMIGDGWRDQFPNRWPNTDFLNHPSRFEFLQLKAEVEELKKLLLEAKKFDEKTGQPHCEMDEKVAFIKKIADTLGVDMTEVFGK